MSDYKNRWQTVIVEVQDGIAWVSLNRPDKRNAMSPTLNSEMIDVLDAVEVDEAAQVLVLTGAGDAWSAGMDLKEYFREIDAKPEIFELRARHDSCEWKLETFPVSNKTTMACAT